MDLLSFVFPKKCLECNKEGKYICSNCLAKVTYQKPVCPACLKPSIDGFTHTGCLTPQALDGLVAPFRYEGVIRKAILTLKYKFASEIASELADCLISSPQGLTLRNQLQATSYYLPATAGLVPIPLHWHRESWRGFNQSEEIGRLIARKLNWPFIPNLLVRKIITTPQTELDREKRLKNIRNVFDLCSNYLQPTTHNSQLILFDDVWTTGSTIKEACKVLKRHGIKNVWGLTIAR